MSYRRFGVVLAVAAATGGIAFVVDRFLVHLDPGVWAALLAVILGCAVACDTRGIKDEDEDQPR